MWSPQHRSLTIVILSAMALSNAVLVAGYVATFQVTPAQVLREVQVVQSDLEISTEAMRSAIAINREQIEQLRKERKVLTEQLRRANESLLKLDPQFKVEPIPTLILE